MAYVSPNFKTKKALKLAIMEGKEVDIYSPGPYPVKQDGEETVEGPHYPEPHKWYARVLVVDGLVKQVLS